VDEVDARDSLIEQYRRESNANVRWAINWAGQRIKAARDSGYTTIEAVLQYFQIDAEMRQQPGDANQEALLRKLQYDLEMNALRDQEASAKRRALGRMAKAGMLGLPGLLMAASSPNTAKIDELKLTNSLPQAPKRRIPPTRPADTDISLYVERLFNNPKPEKRAAAASDLAHLVNNPQALTHLARAFTQDRAPQVQEAAQQAGKLLYWNAVYWQMEQDGSLQAEIARRYQAQSPSADKDAAPPETPAQDITAILKQAEAAREKRKRR
jgi:hypothetical protein